MQGHFPKVRTGRSDYGKTRYFGNEIGFFQEVSISFEYNV